MVSIFKQFKPDQKKFANESELILIKAILGTSEGANKLYKQVKESTAIERSIDKNKFNLYLPYVNSDSLLMNGLDCDVTSSWHDLKSELGDNLRFRILLKRGGFFVFLEGECIDSHPFPINWKICDIDIQSIAPMIIPDITTSNENLLRWLGLKTRTSFKVYAYLPATQLQIESFERENVAIPKTYKDLLRVSNGISFKDIEVLSLQDMHIVDVEDHQELLIAANSNGELFVTTNAANGQESYTAYELSSTSRGKQIADSSKTLVGWLIKQSGS